MGKQNLTREGHGMGTWMSLAFVQHFVGHSCQQPGPTIVPIGHWQQLTIAFAVGFQWARKVMKPTATS